MRRIKRSISAMVIMCLIFVLFAQVTMANDSTEIHPEQNYDYELAMKRGYLTAEDDLPEGIVLEAGEVFIPAAVPSRGHAEAYARMKEMQMYVIDEGSYSTRDFSSDGDKREWEKHTWNYVGYSIDRLALRLTWDIVVTAGVEKLFGWIKEVIGGANINDYQVDTSHPFELPVAVLDAWGKKETADAYGKKMVWSAVTPCNGYAYCHFHLLQVFDRHPDKSGAIFLYEKTRVERGIDYMPGSVSLE